MEKTFFQDKVRGCWFGKCLAGAIGMPFEGVPYTLSPREEDICLRDVPNDDLELQLVWLDAVKQHRLGLTCRDLAAFWLNKIKHGCDEYSLAIHNLQHGIMPPASGWKNNFFANGMGATIRSEIWALLFPERPDAAGYFARQDAEVDHWGDGVRGEIFMAMAEAYACTRSEIEPALRFAFEQLGDDSVLKTELGRVFARFDSGMTEADARRELLLTLQREPNFTDCIMNLSFIVHALLYGGGDFLKTVFLTISFGRDTDCTAASCGAFLGIAKGMEVFPVKWRSLVKDQLCLSDFVSCIPGVPLTLTDLIAQTIEWHDRLAGELPPEPYPAYTPYQPSGELPEIDHQEWLIVDADEVDTAALEEELRRTGKCPDGLRGNIVAFDTLFMDLSPYVKEYRTYKLYSFLTVNHTATPPSAITLSVTADTGTRLFMDGERITQHYSRQKMLPSFHRPEGGGAFQMPLTHGSTHLVCWEFFFAHAPLRACIMFGNQYQDHLDGFDFRIRA